MADRGGVSQTWITWLEQEARCVGLPPMLWRVWPKPCNCLQGSGLICSQRGVIGLWGDSVHALGLVRRSLGPKGVTVQGRERLPIIAASIER